MIEVKSVGCINTTIIPDFNYPLIMCSKSSIILFVRKNTGFLLDSFNGYENPRLGQFADNYSMEGFVPFDGELTITIKNER